ncbi:predicted protein [Sclerotinia sclerotiorum 1980 UF-70]|uniref:Uncharacterized protein n=1 Tax=Sclerotinia sclerotiorum (strain ATCC 18683 / 1980 / Ss-1) TaxID=665079 RepID=A7F036_SCLS1|nr:predicted protein [Sclerotinia sclerotiorum 1980 UF-70]EDN95078.1 predicted protein [Sclerotinia sclerotiorum 1980 UF-70]
MSRLHTGRRFPYHQTEMGCKTLEGTGMILEINDEDSNLLIYPAGLPDRYL